MGIWITTTIQTTGQHATLNISLVKTKIVLRKQGTEEMETTHLTSQQVKFIVLKLL